MQRVYFKDSGQELLWIVIDKKMNVIDCNTQKNDWVGCKCGPKRLKPKEMAWIYNHFSKTRHIFDIEKIEPINQDNT